MTPKVLKYLLDIESVIDEIEEIKRRVGNDFRIYSNDIIAKRAVERDLEIIGEAVRRLTDMVPAIPLTSTKRIIGLRNHLAHAYDSVEDELIWGVIQKHIQY